MANAYDFVLTDPISVDMGLYHGALKGDRAARADIFEKLLRDKILAVAFYLKNSLAIGQTRVAVCTRNDCWIKYDPDEERRQAERAERLKASATPVAQGKPKSTIYQTGIIPVYDIMKGSWISFDVDYVTSIRGVISEQIDELWDERKEYARIGYSGNPSTVMRSQTRYGLTTSSGTGGAGGGGAGAVYTVTAPASGGGVMTTITTHGAGGGGKSGIDTLVNEFARAEQEVKAFNNLPPDSQTPKPVSDILRDYFRALIYHGVDDDLKKEEKQKMFDRISQLYNHKKVP